MKPITKVFINGEDLSDFTYLSVEQTMYDHHSFELVIGHEVIEELGSNTLDKSKDWLGKVAIILFKTNVFLGIVTSVNMEHNHGLFGDLVVRGFSSTILLESAPHLNSWTEKALRDIVDEVMSGLGAEVEPQFQSTIGYMVQYRESNFQFLRRLACDYNEWFFYNGQKLVFGKPAEIPTIPLFYGTDMDNVRISLKVQPVKYNAFSYHSMNNKPIVGSTEDNVSGLGELGAHAFNAAKETFILNPLLSSGPRIPDKGSLDDVLKNLQNSAASSLSMASGNSSKQELRPGVIVDFKANIFQALAWKTKPFGQYLVTKVHHQATGVDEYTNYFEAIPAGVTVLPEPQIPRPTAYPQIGQVITNADPEGKGRIKVQFQWQPKGVSTNWIRVMTPDAGVSDKVGTNRGFVAIPEEGDQVMVGFRYGDPNRPFVLGSMFHGMSAAGGDAKNKMKSITTRSGSTISFNDDENDGSITINDPSGNVVIMDGSGNMTISAPNRMVFNATDIVMNAGNTFSIYSQPGENGSGEGTFTLVAKKDISIGSETESVGIKAETEMNLISKDVTNLSASCTANLGSDTVNVVGETLTTIDGQKVKING